MPKPDFNALRDHLLESGVAPRHVVRIISELSDHQEDLEFEAMRRGSTPESAATQASQRMGTNRLIAAEILGRPELRSWFYRYPRLTRVLLPVAYVVMLPLAPVHAGVANASVIVRWCACMMLSAVVTAAMLLVMQISIAVS